MYERAPFFCCCAHEIARKITLLFHRQRLTSEKITPSLSIPSKNISNTSKHSFWGTGMAGRVHMQRRIFAMCCTTEVTGGSDMLGPQILCWWNTKLIVMPCVVIH